MHTMTDAEITIRDAVPADQAAIWRLAALDSAAAPRGRVLLAEAAGEPVAAISVESARAVADPFRPTAAIVRMLEARAEGIRRAEADLARRGGRAFSQAAVAA